MIACCLWLCVFSVFMGLAPVNTLLEILNSNDLHYVLHATMRDGGMLELKKFIEEQYTVTAGHFNVNTYLKQVKTAIGDRISKRAKLLKKLRDVAAANYQRTSRRTTFKTCCRQRLRDLLWSDLLDRYVNYKGMCLHPPPWLQRETKPNYPGPALLDRFILTHRTDILIRQQYFADENGLQTAYPASRIRNEDCAYMEMRTRPWYVNAVTPPKDIVILVDTSTAMKTKKLDVAKDIAHLLVQTANPNDQLSVFGFSGASVAACGGPSSCYANKSVSPVAFPRRDLHRFISSLSAKGETRYKTGLSKALSMLANQDNSTRHKRRVVVLISGAEPEEDKIGIASFLDTRIQALGVSTKFITICIDCNTRLTKFMNMLISKGNQDVGLYIDVISRKIGEATLLTKTLYEQLRLFFVNLADESMNKAILTTQYYNYIGIGAMVTLSMPVFYRHKFIGVMAIDMAVSDFTTAVKSSVYTYFFLVSQTDGVTLYHPLLPQPTDMEDDPLIVRINFLERDADRKDIIASILRGENGTKKIVVTRIVTLGDSVGDTIEEIVINSTFMWQPIEHMAYSICVVVGERDNEDDTLYTQKNTFGFTYTYHNFISNQDVEKCSYWKRIAAKNKAVVKFPVTAFIDTPAYMSERETSERIGWYADVIHGRRANDIFRPGVRTAVKISSSSSTTWRFRISNEFSYAIRHYLAVPDKMMRISPGVRMFTSYKPKMRGWYKKAARMPGRIVVTRPYFDTFGVGFIISISQAVMLPIHRDGSRHVQNEAIFGVMSIDISVEYLYAKFVSVFPACKREDTECSIIDRAGYVVSHKSLIKTATRKREVPMITSVHITRLFGTVAADLIARGFMNKTYCYDLVTLTRFFKYTLMDEITIGTNDDRAERIGYRMQHVKNSNIYLLWKIKTSTNTYMREPCVCSFWESHSPPQCLYRPRSVCECPCFRFEEYKHCSGHIVGDKWRVCAPFGTEQDFVSKYMKREKPLRTTLKPCFVRHCDQSHAESTCHLRAGCRWCSVSSSGYKMSSPYCGQTSDCYFGMVGHPGLYPDDAIDPPSSAFNLFIYTLVWVILLLIAMIVVYKFDLTTALHAAVIIDDGLGEEWSGDCKNRHHQRHARQRGRSTRLTSSALGLQYPHWAAGVRVSRNHRRSTETSRSNLDYSLRSLHDGARARHMHAHGHHGSSTPVSLRQSKPVVRIRYSQQNDV